LPEAGETQKNILSSTRRVTLSAHKWKKIVKICAREKGRVFALTLAFVEFHK